MGNHHKKENERLRVHVARKAARHIRPCEVDGEPAGFHSWAIQERAALGFEIFFKPDEQLAMLYKFEKTGIIPPGCEIEKIVNVCAIIERENGTVELVPAEKVRFVDRGECNE
jgi:hypothetical protein